MDEASFLAQIREHQGIIYKVVQMYAVDAEEKKDLYQEVLLQCWKGLRGFRGDARFSTWLYRIALNTVLTIKRKKTVVDFTEDLPAEGAVMPEVWEREEVERLQAAIRLLSETDKAVALLFLDGFDIAEMAEVLGISAAHASVKVYRVKQRLAKRLKETAHE